MENSQQAFQSDGNLLKQAALAAVQWPGFLFSEVTALFRSEFRHPFRRALWLLPALPLLTLQHILNWICLLLDEVLFPAARNVHIVKPVFIVGPPRSGTTHFHRILTELQPGFSVATAREVLLAPSILQKKSLRALIRLDRACGRPLARMFTVLERSCLRAFSDTHPGSLRDPEEDYFYLAPLLACSGWFLAFHAWRGFRACMPGNPRASEAKRRAALQFYRRCLRKQLYVDGPDKTLLNKNASFSSWMDLLPEFFPDARFLVCMRSPLETVPSMLSTAEKAMHGFASGTRGTSIQDLLVDCMKAHYQTLYRYIPLLPADQRMVVEQTQLKMRLTEVMQQVCSLIECPLSPASGEQLEKRDAESRRHRSRHRYQLEVCGVDASDLLSACPVLSSTVSSST